MKAGHGSNPGALEGVGRHAAIFVVFEGVMKDLIDVRGASGAAYRFAMVREGRALSPIGGNYLFVRETGDGYEIVHAGEGQNLINDAKARWDEARAAHGALHLFTRLNISEGVRRHEHEDIVAAVRPAMNEAAAG
jgi:hypothetical protein